MLNRREFLITGVTGIAAASCGVASANRAKSQVKKPTKGKFLVGDKVILSNLECTDCRFFDDLHGVKIGDIGKVIRVGIYADWADVAFNSSPCPMTVCLESLVKILPGSFVYGDRVIDHFGIFPYSFTRKRGTVTACRRCFGVDMVPVCFDNGQDKELPNGIDHELPYSKLHNAVPKSRLLRIEELTC